MTEPAGGPAVEVTYHGLVRVDDDISVGAVTQWRGELRDGRYFYFRHHHGVVVLGLGETPTEAAGDRWQASTVIEGLGDDLMTVDDYHDLFERLYRHREARATAGNDQHLSAADKDKVDRR